MDHSFPITALLIEFIFASSVPFTPRQGIIIPIVLIIYMFLNITWVKVDNNTPIYAPMTWNNVWQFIYLPIGFFIGAFLIWLALYKLRKMQLRYETNEILFSKIYSFTLFGK